MSYLLSYTCTKPSEDDIPPELLGTPYRYYSFRINSIADEMYDFKIIINQCTSENPIKTFKFHIYGNNHDAYSLSYRDYRWYDFTSDLPPVDLWPGVLPKRVGNQLVYQLDFWFNSPNTPLINTTAVRAGCYISVIVEEKLDITLVNCNKIYYSNSKASYNRNLLSGIRQHHYTHSEQRLVSGITRKLYKAIDNQYNIYADGSFVIETTDGKQSVMIQHKYTFTTTSNTICVHYDGLPNHLVILTYRKVNSWFCNESTYGVKHKDVLIFLIPHDTASVMYDSCLVYDIKNFDDSPVLYILLQKQMVTTMLLLLA